VATAAAVTDTVGPAPDGTATDGTAADTGVGDPTTTVPADPTGGTDATTADGTTTTPEPTTTTGPDDAATTPSEPDDDWPDGRTAWAVILISEEREDHTRVRWRVSAERRRGAD
jgi:hypothetical protein